MAELLLELYSEEIPPQLQISARSQIKQYIENECKSLLEKKLSLPAYDQCLKASHIFNLLDARGVIGVAERTGYITRIRELAKGCGALWLSSQS